MSRYQLELSESGDFTAVAPKPEDIPRQIAEWCDRYRKAFGHLRQDGAYDEKRRAFARMLLQEATAVLESEAPDAVPTHLRDVEYVMSRPCAHGAVSMENDTLHFWKLPWLVLADDVTAFWGRIDRMVSKVRWLIADATKRRLYLDQLVSHAKFGLEQGDIKGAGLALDQFADQFVAEEGPSIRQKYLMSTLKWACGAGAATLALYGIIVFGASEPKIEDLLPENSVRVARIMLSLVVGTGLGVVFFAFVRNLNMTFDTIGNFDPNRLKAGLRFAMVATITAIACLFLYTGLIKIEIGNVNFGEFSRKGSVAMLLGIICGYADASITAMLTGVLDGVKKA